MEPLTIATAFAEIVGLLGLFKSEGANREANTIGEYLEWLRRRDHQQLVDLISQNADVSGAISALLERQHDEVVAKLTDLDKVLSSVAGRLPDFQPLAVAIRPETVLPDQGVSILRQLNKAGASQFLEVGSRAGRAYLFLDGNGESLRIEDDRFISDDLETLCELGLLRLGFNKQGSRIFTITRPGAKIGD
jgi:hypothetical protein